MQHGATVLTLRAQIAVPQYGCHLQSGHLCQTVLSSWYRSAATISWGRCSWMMFGFAFCGTPTKGVTAQTPAGYTFLFSGRQPPPPPPPSSHTHNCRHKAFHSFVQQSFCMQSAVRYVWFADVTCHGCMVCQDECPPPLQARLLYAILVTASVEHSAKVTAEQSAAWTVGLSCWSLRKGSRVGWFQDTDAFVMMQWNHFKRLCQGSRFGLHTAAVCVCRLYQALVSFCICQQ